MWRIYKEEFIDWEGGIRYENKSNKRRLKRNCCSSLVTAWGNF